MVSLFSLQRGAHLATALEPICVIRVYVYVYEGCTSERKRKRTIQQVLMEVAYGRASTTKENIAGYFIYI